MKRIMWCYLLFSFLFIHVFSAHSQDSLCYRVKALGVAADGVKAPLWFTANQYGVRGTDNRQAVLSVGLNYLHSFPSEWKIRAGLEVDGGSRLVSDFWVHQAYVDVQWKLWKWSVGSKERLGFPLVKDAQLSSGWMVEGTNARPIPQMRLELSDYWSVPGLHGWLAVKGHLAFGRFLDGAWQEQFVSPGHRYTKGVHYHSKSLSFRLGNRDKFPVEWEFGVLLANQFSGKQYLKRRDGSSELKYTLPSGWKAYWKAFFPQEADSDNPVLGERNNVEGNVVGSWNFSLNWYVGDWMIRSYYEHYFEDHSQMFNQYGRWKDGQLAFEVTPPCNRWVRAVVWEMVCTKDQSGPFQTDDSLWPGEDFLLSGGDDYYNHYLFQSWQYYGMGMGNPLLPGPIYNKNGSLSFRSNRVRGHHLGMAGQPSSQWDWRLLASFVRHWGTYSVPLDKQRKQFSGLAEIGYAPRRVAGWKLSVAVGLDRGNYLGNSCGVMVSCSGKFSSLIAGSRKKNS